MGITAPDGQPLRAENPGWLGLNKKLAVTTDNGTAAYVDGTQLKYSWERNGDVALWRGNDQLTRGPGGTLTLNGRTLSLSDKPSGTPTVIRPRLTYQVVDASNGQPVDPQATSLSSDTLNPKTENGLGLELDPNGNVTANGRPVYASSNGVGFPVTALDGHPQADGKPIRMSYDPAAGTTKVTLHGQDVSLTTQHPSTPTNLQFPLVDASGSPVLRPDGSADTTGSTLGGTQVVVDGSGEVTANGRPVFTSGGDRVTVDGSGQPLAGDKPIQFIFDTTNNIAEMRVDGRDVSLTDQVPKGVPGRISRPLSVTAADGSVHDVQIGGDTLVHDINGVVMTPDGKNYATVDGNRLIFRDGKLQVVTDSQRLGGLQPLVMAADGSLTLNGDPAQLSTSDANSIPELSRYPNPGGEPNLARIYKWLISRNNRSRNADNSVFHEMVRQGRIRAEEFQPDSAVREMANIVGGVLDFILNGHFHRRGYDQRTGFEVDSTANRSVLSLIGAYARVVWGSVGEFCGPGHYSEKNTSEVDHINTPELDERDLNGWKRLFAADPKSAAKISMSLVGADPSRPGAADYLFSMLRGFPGIAASVGETPIKKELVTVQLGDNAIELNSPSLHEALNAQNETGMRAHYHSDSGHHGLGPDDGRPQAVQQAYEHIAAFIRTFKQYPDLKRLWAHAGSGRVARASSEMIDYVDPKTGDTRLMTLHAAEVRYVLDALPGAHIDLAWNDVTENLANNEQLRQDFADIMVEYRGRVHYGSDELKAENAGMSLQSLMAGIPMFGDVALRNEGEEALWQFFRGTGGSLLKSAEDAVDEWTKQDFRIDESGQKQLQTARDGLLKQRMKYANLVDLLALQEKPELMRQVYDEVHSNPGGPFADLIAIRDGLLGTDPSQQYGHGSSADLLALREWARNTADPAKDITDAQTQSNNLLTEMQAKYPTLNLTAVAGNTRSELRAAQQEVDSSVADFKQLRENLNANGTLDAARAKDLQDMHDMRSKLRDEQAELDAGARARFDEWVLVLTGQRLDQASMTSGAARPTSSVYAEPPPEPRVQTWADKLRTRLGKGTVYGDPGEPEQVKRTWWTALPLIAGADAAAVEIGMHLAKGASGLLRDYLSPAAFIARAALTATKTINGEAQRLTSDDGLENGNWSDRSLNQAVRRLYELQKPLGISDARMAQFARVTEQFRANLSYLYGLPLEAFSTLPSDPAKGVTDQDLLMQKFYVIMGEVGKYQIQGDRALGFQASSVTPFDPAAPVGKLYRALTTLTYGTNVASSANFFLDHPELLFNTPLHAVGAISGILFNGLFGAANLALMDTTMLEGVSGFFKNNLLAMTKSMRATQAGAMRLFLPAGIAWDSTSIVNGFASHPLMTAPAVALQSLFAKAATQIANNDWNRGVARRAVPGPEAAAKPYYELAAALALAEALVIAQNLLGQQASSYLAPPPPQYGTGLHFAANNSTESIPTNLPGVPTQPGVSVPR